MPITKTDYLEYTHCKKNLWLQKHKPELFEGVELSEFEKKIIEEGNIADEAARNLFPGGELIEIVGPNAAAQTKRLLDQHAKTGSPQTIFQGGFLHEEFFVQADILHYNTTLQGFELFEVKASNDVKREIPNHHINDLAFQKTVIESTGVQIVKTGVIHLSSQYRKHRTINYQDLFIIADVTDEVLEAQQEVGEQMQELKAYLGMPEEHGCECIYRGRSAQCTTFAYSNPKVPEYSVHDINRIGGSKKLLWDWIDRGIYAIEEIDNPEALKGAKRAQYDAYMLGKPLIDHEGIQEMLGELEFPLYFFDYEGYSSAIPKFDGFGAYEQTPFQYSLHILGENGELEQKEFLITEPQGNLTRPLVERMREDIGDKGSVVAWHKSYEAQRNNKLAEVHPDYAVFLEEMNDRMFDLKDIFAKNLYVDAAFKGSASIKNILPVLVPELTYKALGIQKGDQAVERWEKMIDPATTQEEKDQIAADLLEYCKLDTLAMVRIYQQLRQL